jgi:hypothetical protein
MSTDKNFSGDGFGFLSVSICVYPWLNFFLLLVIL